MLEKISYLKKAFNVMTSLTLATANKHDNNIIITTIIINTFYDVLHQH